MRLPKHKVCASQAHSMRMQPALPPTLSLFVACPLLPPRQSITLFKRSPSAHAPSCSRATSTLPWHLVRQNPVHPVVVQVNRPIEPPSPWPHPTPVPPNHPLVCQDTCDDFIAQNPVDSIVVEVDHPVESLHLILAQRTAGDDGRLHLQAVPRPLALVLLVTQQLRVLIFLVAVATPTAALFAADWSTT
eukprot:362630-Chlamydomonas_euryale.AAC.2